MRPERKEKRPKDGRFYEVPVATWHTAGPVFLTFSTSALYCCLQAQSSKVVEPPLNGEDTAKEFDVQLVLKSLI